VRCAEFLAPTRLAAKVLIKAVTRFSAPTSERRVLCTPTGDRSQGTADTAGTLPPAYTLRACSGPRACAGRARLREMIESRHGRVAGLFEQTCQGWIDSAKAHE
jgi:hypothetical protein